MKDHKSKKKFVLFVFKGKYKIPHWPKQSCLDFSHSLITGLPASTLNLCIIHSPQSNQVLFENYISDNAISLLKTLNGITLHFRKNLNSLPWPTSSYTIKPLSLTLP